MFKRIVCLLSTVVLSVQAGNDAEQASLKIADDGKSLIVIALAKGALPAEENAALQLQKYLGQITGAQIPLRGEEEVSNNEPQILVGTGDRVRELLPSQDWGALKKDGIVIKSVGNKLILTGGRPRGSLYAVFEFLEDVVGCRWWTDKDSEIPQIKSLSIPSQDLVYIPPFDYREHFSASIRKDPVFATIMRENGHFLQQDEKWGGHYTVQGWCHTFRNLLPVEEYFAQHPEWYSDPLNNYLPCTKASKQPHFENTQLCLSNPEVVEEVAKNALSWIRKNPEAGYISISQNDSPNAFCRCAKCAKITREEGAISGPLVKFVNEVAARIAVEYPDTLVETLAYQATEKPPKTIRPAKNVIIRFAPIGADFGHPLDDQLNTEVTENLKEWARISPQLFVWNYVTNFKAPWLPHPNWSGLGSDLRFFAANKVKGVYEQGDTYGTTVGDFIQLRTWLLGKLLWNPSLDQVKLTDEFLAGYYGKAAPFLQRYLSLIQNSFQKQGYNLVQDNADYSFLTLDVMNQATRFFDQAEEAVQDDALFLERVRRERLPLELAWVYRYNKLKPLAQRDKKEFLGPSDPRAALAAIKEQALQYGDICFTDNGAYHEVIPILSGLFSKAAGLPDFAKECDPNEVIDLQQNSFYLYRKGEISGTVADDQASDGEAAYINGDVNDWAAQALLSWAFEGTSKTRCQIYAMVKLVPKENGRLTGNGVNCGVYDGLLEKSLKTETIPAESFRNGEYQCVDLGTHEVDGKTYVWFSPTLNPAIEKIYIDRVILVRKGQG